MNTKYKMQYSSKFKKLAISKFRLNENNRLENKYKISDGNTCYKKIPYEVEVLPIFWEIHYSNNHSKGL